MTGTHQCPAENCDQRVPDHQLMCPRHWFQVPKRIRDEVWAAYRQEPLSDRHMAAIKAARNSLRP